ncbi:hypothetical protein EMCRGX_G003702 [Ephydatia muelleri]
MVSLSTLSGIAVYALPRELNFAWMDSALLPKETKSNMSITPLCQVNLLVLQQSNMMYYVVFTFLLPVVLIKELSDLLDQIWYEHKWGSPQFFSTRGTH